MRSAYSKHRKMNQLESCETNLSFKNILDVVNKAFLSFSSKAKNIHNSWYSQQKRNADINWCNIYFLSCFNERRAISLLCIFHYFIEKLLYLLKKDNISLSLKRLRIYTLMVDTQVERIEDMLFNGTKWQLYL